MSNFEKLLTEIRKDITGKSFEKFCKWFLENDPYWKTQVEQVWLFDDWPEKWHRDKGVDLVFKHKNGQNWAVQAKCYSEKYYIKKEDIDSFLSESSRKIIHQRLLIGTTDKLGRNAKETMNGQEKPIRSFLLSELRDSGLKYPSSLKNLSTKVNKKKINKDRSYQQEAINKVVDGFKKHDRGKLIMACGTGKTLVTLWIKEKLKPQTTLVLLPSLNLLSQTLFEWTTHCKDPFEVLCICSDTTVGKQGRSEDMKVTDAYFDVTSDVFEISQFLKLDKPKVIFCTYQSSELLSQAQKQEEIDLIIFDEAHRCTGLAKSTFTKALENKSIKAKKRLFTTATPRIFSSYVKTVASNNKYEIYGMDDESIYGPIFFEYTFGQAIDEGWLTDYQVVIIGVDEPTVKTSIDERELIAINKEKYEDAETLASKIIIAKAIKNYDMKRIITFHNRVNDAQKFSNDFQDVLKLLHMKDRPKGTIWTDYISGLMTTKDRKLKLTQLKKLFLSDRGIVSNAKCLSEGIDVPSLDGVAFVDPKGSQIDIIQSVGRALRKSEEKNLGTIILPIFIKAGDNDEDKIEKSNFKHIWNVLKALRSHDNLLAKYLDDLRLKLGANNVQNIGKLLSKVIIDLPKSYDTNFSNSLKIHLVKNVTSNWLVGYSHLLNYVNKYNSASPNSSFSTPCGFNLGAWVVNQRSRKEILNKDQISQLENLIGWVWNTNDASWEEGFNQLNIFFTTFGHINISHNYKTHDGFNLGRWVIRQRYRRHNLTKDQINKLASLKGWIWNTNQTAWEKGFYYLKKYSDKFNNINFVNSYKTSDGYALGNWTSIQRSRKSRLTKDQIKKLDNLGFVWEVNELQWNKGYNLLISYINKYGDASIDKNRNFEEKEYLISWLARQRASYKKQSITTKRKKLLEEINDWSWDPQKDLWENGIKHLKIYVEKEGNALVPDDFIQDDGFKLGQWIRKRRTSYKRNKLDKEKIKYLESLNDWTWDPINDHWDRGFLKLKKFYTKYEHPNVPTSFTTEDGFRLGAWVDRQRQNIKKSKITKERREKIESLNGWALSVKEALWDKGFRELIEYIEVTNNSDVPLSYISKNNYKLGSWVARQRSSRTKNSLTQQQKEKLKKLPNWKWSKIK